MFFFMPPIISTPKITPITFPLAANAALMSAAAAGAKKKDPLKKKRAKKNRG